jgi:fatty acid/phospholipid biosynthesis enzyme
MQMGESRKAIAVDAMGSDMGPSEVVAGVAHAFKNNWVFDRIVLVGQEEVLNQACEEHGLTDR